MNKFRLLKADEIECRISRITEKGLALLLYKTARTDANLLDETVGEEMWENDFKLIDDVLYGGIGIHRLVSDIDGRVTDKVVWKWDAGTESNTEAEKGRASDAFKRAGFKWGIGRELYTAPFIWIPNTKCKIENGKCYEKFEVTTIKYDKNGYISALTIVNDKSRVEVFSWSSKDKPKESFSGADKIGKTKVTALTKTLKDNEIPVGFVCEQFEIKSLSQMTEEQFQYTATHIEGLKAKYNEWKNS